MTELRCDANKGLESFWIESDSTVAKAVWMGLDDQEGPRISTTAKGGADVVDASSEDKRTDFDDAAELDVYLGGQIVPVRGRPGRAGGCRAGLGLRDLQLPNEQFPHRHLCEGGGRMGFAPFGVELLMGLLTLTAYACCAVGDDRD